jgi:hypothetical protein
VSMTEKTTKVSNPSHDKLLALLAGQKTPTAEELKQLILALDNHRVLAKVFVLEGTPYVFENRPMKYVIFREQVADRFEIGSQDVCIVGSAKLGYSPSAHQFGRPFAETSDVDVVIISELLFYRGSKQLFETLNQLEPSVSAVRSARFDKSKQKPEVNLDDWLKVKDSVRNFVYQNFNPGLLPQDHPLRREIFENMASTSGLFLALEPQVFVSKIRCRVFRNWKAAEDYYSHTLLDAKYSLKGEKQAEPEIDDTDELLPEVAISPPAEIKLTPSSAATEVKVTPSSKVS